MDKKQKYILWFKEINKGDVSLVGGKNASLGEMFNRLNKVGGINVPDGFALTSRAYWSYLKENGVDKKIREIFKNFKVDDLDCLKRTSREIRSLILKGKFSDELKKKIIDSYRELSQKYKEKYVDVAVRSSATAEDLPTASFAGAHETYLNVRGEERLLEVVKNCIASLFLERAISYRQKKGFSHTEIALSVGVQKMVRSDLASSGVMFTLDTETGFSNVILINSIYGLGEMIVKGRVTPDEFFVFKPTLEKGYKAIIRKNLGRKVIKYEYGAKGGIKEVRVSKNKQEVFSLTDEEVLTLAHWGCQIEKHYGCAQDIEWAKDGKSGKLFIVQSRPETIYKSTSPGLVAKSFQEYQIKLKKGEKPILTGMAIGGKIGIGRVRIISDISKLKKFNKGDVLVTKMTDPDWVPIMGMASAIITDEGGKTCHSAIVSRELGVPAIVGTERATKLLKEGEIVTADCSQGLNGRVYRGKISFEIKKYNLKKIPKLKTKIMVNIGAPEIAFKSSFLPVSGVGLAREEFIIAEKIRIHPLALYYHNRMKKEISSNFFSQEKFKKNIPGTIGNITKIEVAKIIKKIDEITIEHKNKKDYFIKELAEGIGQIGAAFWPRPVIVRFSDFKTNEYAQLIGGSIFEPADEPNPMLGWRGASRYYDKKFKPAFLMECEAIKRIRNVFGLKNIELMVPFCRTVEEGEKVLEIIKKAGLNVGLNQSKSEDRLKIYVMCEIPSNVILIERFLEVFDGVSIGSNDLTQLSLGIDRDNGYLQKISDERNATIIKMIKQVIQACRKKNKYCGICGQAPSDYPEFARFLFKEGIESLSLTPDTVMKTILASTKYKK